MVQPWLRFHIPLIEPRLVDLPRPALRQELTPSPTARRAQAGSRIDLSRTGMSVAVRSGAPKPDIGTVDAFRRALLAAPTVAYADGGASGVQFHSILGQLGIAEAMKGKLRPYPPGGAVDGALPQ